MNNNFVEHSYILFNIFDCITSSMKCVDEIEEPDTGLISVYGDNMIISNMSNVIVFNYDLKYYISYLEKLSQLDVDHLPKKLIDLYFRSTFNENVDHLPNSLRGILFGDEFNKNVDYLPESIKCLIFKKSFNQHVDHLPKSLKKTLF